MRPDLWQFLQENTGSIPVGGFGGWIHIKKEDDGTIDVMWTSGEDDHCRAFHGPCYSVGYQDRKPISWYKTALSLWPIKNEWDRAYAASFIEAKIEKAFTRSRRDWTRLSTNLTTLAIAGGTIAFIFFLWRYVL